MLQKKSDGNENAKTPTGIELHEQPVESGDLEDAVEYTAQRKRERERSIDRSIEQSKAKQSKATEDSTHGVELTSFT